MDPRDETRMVELETRLAFQDHTLSVLNETVVEQSRLIEQLSRRLELALDDLRRVRTTLLADPGQEPPPPHY